MKHSWLERFYRPNGNVHNVREIPFEEFFSAGYRLILMDIDNTLAVHGEKEPGPLAVETLKRIRSAGLRCIVVSNALPTRLHAFCEKLGVEYIPHARKPSPRGVLLACGKADVRPEQAMLVGDQLFTDIAAANRAGCVSIRVFPLSLWEPLPIMFKRFFEFFIRHWLKLNETYLSIPDVSGDGRTA